VWQDYESDDCTWIPMPDQMRNQRRTKLTRQGADVIRDWLAQGLAQQSMERWYVAPRTQSCRRSCAAQV